MRRHHRNEVHRFAVHVERDGWFTPSGGIVVIRDQRNTRHVGRGSRQAVRARRLTQHLVTQILLRVDQRALFGEEGIGAGVIAMHVRVDEDPDWGVGERPDSRECFFGDLPVLRIHHQDAVGSEEHHHSSAGRVGMRRIESLRTMEHE